MKSKFLVLAIPDEEAIEDEEPREDTLADIPPLLTPAALSSPLVLLDTVNPSKLFELCSFY